MHPPGGDTAAERERRVCPPRLVNVLWCGRWRKAQLEGYRFSADGDRALIRFPPDRRNEIQDPHWVPIERVRRRLVGI